MPVARRAIFKSLVVLPVFYNLSVGIAGEEGVGKQVFWRKGSSSSSSKKWLSNSVDQLQPSSSLLSSHPNPR